MHARTRVCVLSACLSVTVDVTNKFVELQYRLLYVSMLCALYIVLFFLPRSGAVRVCVRVCGGSLRAKSEMHDTPSTHVKRKVRDERRGGGAVRERALR